MKLKDEKLKIGDRILDEGFVNLIVDRYRVDTPGWWLVQRTNEPYLRVFAESWGYKKVRP
jgi:hypothetical protein